MKEARMPTTSSTDTFYLKPRDIANLCEGASKHGDSWSMKCPTHTDRSASLRVSKGRKATIVYCHAGCTTSDILDALELGMEQLYYNYDPTNPHSPHSSGSLKLKQMVRDSKPPTMRELAPATTLEDVLWPVMVATPEVWAWVRVRWSDWMSMPFVDAMKKHWVVTDAICADLMVREIDEGYDYTVKERHRLRDRLEEQWATTKPLT